MKRNYYLQLLAAALLFLSTQLNAQINPALSSYFQNPYINNPAWAGRNEGLNLNLSYSREWENTDGAPTSGLLAGDYKTGNMGFGALIRANSEGLINNNKYLASYAYHLKLNGKQSLSFGLSAGISTNKLDASEIIGDMDDEMVALYNNNKIYADADFGMLYSYGDLSVEAVAQNLKQYFYGSEENFLVPLSNLYSSVSYKFRTQLVNLEPKLVYRNIENYDNIIDAGLNAVFLEDKFSAVAMYHSTKNATLGVGIGSKNNLQIQIFYTTPLRNNYRSYTNGSLELGLRLKL